MSNQISGFFISFSPDEEETIKKYCEENEIDFSPSGIKSILLEIIDQDKQDGEDEGSVRYDNVLNYTREFIRNNPEAIKHVSKFMSRAFFRGK